MNTYVYLSKEGQKYSVFHRNQSNRTWEHPYAERKTCAACLGTSEAAPPDSVPARERKEEA